MSSSLPSFRFRLFGLPVAIGIDFLLITVLLGLQARPGIYLLEWLVVVAVSILIHELGHAFALRQYGINPEIRLWGMGGLTSYSYALPPRKSIYVSLAGPLVGIPVAMAVMVIKPWLPASEPLAYITTDLVFINLWWGLLNLLPLAGLDGGNATTNLFLLAMGERGRRPGLIVVGVASVVVAIVAAFAGFVFLTIVILFFGLMNPEPYLALWRMVGGSGGRSSGARARGQAWAGGYSNAARPGGSLFARAAAAGDAPRKRGKDRPVIVGAADARRVFGELYGAVVPVAQSEPGADLDLDELEQRPSPLLPDVIGMVARHDDPALAGRLAAETDPLAVLGIAQRVVEAKRVPELTAALRRSDDPARVSGLLKLQVGLHALGRFEDAIAAAQTVGKAGGGESAALEARSAARLGDRKRAAAALERALALGVTSLPEAALGDIARLGPDRGVSDLLSRFRNVDPGG